MYVSHVGKAGMQLQHFPFRTLAMSGNVMWNLDLVVEKSNPQVPCLSWNDISIVVSHRASHRISVTP